MRIELEIPVWLAAISLVFLVVDIALRVRLAYWEGRRAKAEIEHVTDEVLEKLREASKS